MTDERLLTDVIDKQMESAYFVGKHCVGFPPEVKERIKREIIKAAEAACQKKIEGLFEDIEPYIKQITEVTKSKDGDMLIDPVLIAALSYYWAEAKVSQREGEG